MTPLELKVKRKLEKIFTARKKLLEAEEDYMIWHKKLIRENKQIIGENEKN